MLSYKLNSYVTITSFLLPFKTFFLSINNFFFLIIMAWPFWNLSLFPIPKQRRWALLFSLRNKLRKQFCCISLPWTLKNLRHPPLLCLKRNNFIVEKKRCFNAFNSEIILGILRQGVFHILCLSIAWDRKFHLFNIQRRQVHRCQGQFPSLPGDRHGAAGSPQYPC